MTDSSPRSFRGIPGVTIEPLACPLADLRLTLDAPARRLDPAARQRIDDHWSRETARNPRLFDGPILSCVETDPAAALIRCRRASYRELLCQPIVDTGVMQMSVTGALLAADTSGRAHILLARRGPQTRIYAHQWELAPSGGLDPPPRTTSEATPHLTGADAFRQLLLEIEEELALPIPPDTTPPQPACLCLDHTARSTDIVLRIRLDPATSAASLASHHTENWEYAETRWIPLEDLPAFDAHHAADIIPPSRALFRFFNWL